jgi:hypothetical protein
VKRECETKKRDNNNISPPPLIIENFVRVNNQLNLPSSSSSLSSNSSSSSSFSLFSSSSSKYSNYSTKLAMFPSLKSAALAYSLESDLRFNVDGNNEDAIDRLLKVRDNVPMHCDKNSIIYAVLSQLNPKRWGGKTLAYTYDPYNLLNNYNLQGY